MNWSDAIEVEEQAVMYSAVMETCKDNGTRLLNERDVSSQMWNKHCKMDSSRLEWAIYSAHLCENRLVQQSRITQVTNKLN